MKKEYIIPELKVFAVEAVVMAAESLTLNATGSADLGDAKAGEGGSTWDDED